MPVMKRFKKDYVGVILHLKAQLLQVENQRKSFTLHTGAGVVSWVEEKAGRQYSDPMTPAKLLELRGVAN